MATNPEEEINRLNRALQETLSLLADLKRVSIASGSNVVSAAEIKALETYNALLAERARLSGTAGAGNVGRDVTAGAGSQTLKQLDIKRQQLLKEQEALRKQTTSSYNVKTNEFSTLFPPGVEERINKITAAVTRLNQAEAKLRGGAINAGGGIVSNVPSIQQAQERLTTGGYHGEAPHKPDTGNITWTPYTLSAKEAAEKEATATAKQNKLLTDAINLRNRAASAIARQQAAQDRLNRANQREAEPVVGYKFKKGISSEAEANDAQNKLFTKSIADKLKINSDTIKRESDYISLLQKEAAAVDKLTNKKNAQAKAEQELATARKLISSDPRYREALEQATARGFTADDLRKIEDRGGNVQRLQFQRTQGGVNQQFNPYVNMLSGKSTAGLSSQFRTFGSDIARDIGQFAKWSIAVAAVYTPLQKLGELMAIMVDNESRLADATIAANVPFEKSGEIFDTVAISANKAGESINTTIDAYTQAIRAAGRYNTEGEKQAKATALLNDSLILSKLSTLDQSDAIDTLSAALLQSDRELNQGQELLNKWVRVSQIANVGIDALAVGVAVLGDAAETSGLSIDQLNGLIAVLSEQSISGSKEAANTAKALVGAYQSDKAEAALNKYGIALRKANGEVRGFLEIYQELSKLRQQGVLSEAAVSEIALSLGGGGVRRAKDASALINSTDRLNALAAESAKVTGEDSIANDSLAKKLETVQTANTRLANSFQELAQTLGDKGGLLDGMKGLVNLLTLAVRGSNELFSVLGRSGPILATIVAGLGAMTAYYGVGGRKDTALTRLGANLGTFYKGGQFLPGGGHAPPGGTTIGASGGGILGDIIRMNRRGASIIGAAGVGLQAGSNLAAGKNENALANVVGGLAGGFLGSLSANPLLIAVGANIGSAAGDALLNFLDSHSQQLGDYFTPKTPSNAPTPETTPEAAKAQTTSELLDQAWSTLSIGQKFDAWLKQREARPTGPNGAYEKYTTKESAGAEFLKTANPALYTELFSRNAKAVADAAVEAAKQAAQNPATSGQYAGKVSDLESQAALARRQQLDKLATGQITSAEFGRISNQIGGFPATSVKAVTNLGDALYKVNKNIKDDTDAYNAFLYIATNGTQEQINLISGYSDDILTLKGYIDNWKPELVDVPIELSFGTVHFKSAKEAQDYIDKTLRPQGAQAFNSVLGQVQQTQAQKVTLPPLVGDYNKPTALEDYNKAVEKGKEIQLKYYESVGKTDQEIQSLIAGIETFYTTVSVGSEAVFKATSGLEQRFYDLAKASAEAAKGFGLQQFDVDRATLEKLAAQSIQMGQNWAQQFPGFETNPEDALAITNDSIAKPIHADFKILALLLEKIVDQNQKQLDGQYNIPEGATFWVPLTAAYYRNKGGTDMGGTTTGNNQALDSNTKALQELAQAFRGDRGYSRVAEAQKNAALGYRGDTGQSRKAEADKQAALGFRGDLGYGRTSPVSTTQSTANNQLLQSLQSLNNTLMQRQSGFGFPSFQTPADKMKNTNAPTSPTTKLDLRLSSNVNLLVDGRILAQTLQSYFASELLRTEQTQGTITRRYTI
jgi:TP901 family phage tail tape measure protein